MSASTLTSKDGVPRIVRLVDERGLEKVAVDADTLLRYGYEALRFGEQSLFGALPAALDRMIERKIWKEREPPFRDFGQMALAPTGLGVTNNRGLSLLRAAMDVEGRHIEAWADVLAAVEQAVKVQVAETGKSSAYMRAHPDEFGALLSYAPGKSSYDHNLLDLRRTDRTTFRQVVKGETTVGKIVRARRKPNPEARFARMQSTWKTASKAERKRFLSWIEDGE